MSYTIFTADPVIPLRDFANDKSVIKLERVLDLTVQAGGSGSFDPMLQNWIGGTGVLNGFRLTNVPAGTYRLLLYAGNGGSATQFHLSVNLQPYTLKTATPTGALDFVEDDNYVAFDSLTLAVGSALDIRVYGFLAGLQLLRTT